MMSVETRFLDFMRAVCLAPVKSTPVADGKIHRYRVEGDKPSSKNGWCVLRLDPIGHGAVGSWRTGEAHNWRDQEARCITRAESADLRSRMWEIRQARFREERQVWEETRAKAGRLWHVSRLPDAAHPYLVKKGVKAWGIHQLRNSLVIPLRDSDCVLHSLQFIDQEGNKRFLTGGRVQGHYHAIGRPADTLCICEGYATAASIFEATGHATAVAFNAGNLLPVTRRLWIKFPKIRIVVCADDDHATPGNPGLTEAYRAARMVGGLVARPDFTNLEVAE